MEASIAMTTKEKVKPLLTIELADTDFDVLLDDLIQVFSDAAQALMNRLVKTAARTRVYNLPLGSRRVMLNAYGDATSVITKVTHDLNRVFGTSGTEVLAADRAFDFRIGALYLDNQLIAGKQVLEVQWTGGMAVDTTTFRTNWRHLAHACEQQVSHIFTRRGELGTERQSFRDNIITEAGDPSRWLKWVEETFRRNRRRSLAK